MASSSFDQASDPVDKIEPKNDEAQEPYTIFQSTYRAWILFVRVRKLIARKERCSN